MNNYDINIMDIRKKQYEKDKRRLEIYSKILHKCYYKINSTSDNEYEHCFFRVPEYVMGSPIYNLTKCVIFLLQKLRENGFKCKYCHPFMIYISWGHKNNSKQIPDSLKFKSGFLQKMSISLQTVQCN